MPNSIIKKRLAVHLLKVVLSIYLTITVFITLTQMFNEYWREQANLCTRQKPKLLNHKK
jgi:hypothetical protein